MSPRGARRSSFPPDIRKLSTSRDNIVVSQLLALPAAPPRRQDHYLTVAHGLGISQSEDSGVLKLRSKNLAAVPDVYCRDDKGQNAAELVRERKVFQLEGGSGFED